MGACKENVVFDLRIWEDEGAAMKYPVCFCGKEDGRYGEGGRELPCQGGWHCWYGLHCLCLAYQILFITAKGRYYDTSNVLR